MTGPLLLVALVVLTTPCVLAQDARLCTCSDPSAEASQEPDTVFHIVPRIKNR